jgi:type IV pilus assembly protein PilX
MTTGQPFPHPCHLAQRRAQSGVVMVMTLICLVLMLIASVALTRSSTNSLLQAGNFAFKRDLLNQAERGFAQAVTDLNAASTLTADVASINYSATQLASNAQGIPNVLINDSTFTSSGLTGSDITDSTSGITIRTVIDRQCSAVGTFSTTNCVPYVVPTNTATSGTARLKQINGEEQATYRISVHVMGPRNTEVFQQMIVTL